MSDGHVSQRRSMIDGGVVSVLLQTRHRGVAPRGRRGGWVWRSLGDCGAMPYEETRRPPLCLPPAPSANAQLSAKCILALVIPT